MLHESISLGTLKLKNRLVLPPMATEKCSGGTVTDDLLSYYDRMTAGGYLGLAETEHCYISPEGQASPYQLSIADDSCLDGLKRLVDVIHKNGVPAAAQISHAGCAMKTAVTGIPSGLSPSPAFRPREAEALSGKQALPKEMTEEDIRRVTACFADAAARAKAAGYDAVEIHSAHGYLLNQFYSPLINRRTDSYTGSNLEGRLRLHLEVIRAVRARVGSDYPVFLRLGACDYMDGGSSVSDVAQAARILTEAGIDMLSVTGGMYGYNRKDTKEQGWFSELSREAKKGTDIPVLLTGGITEKSAAEALLQDGSADLIGVGRAFLKDPELPKKWMG